LLKFGLGTLWTSKGLADSTEPICNYKLDSKASREHQALSGCGTTVRIPLENDSMSAGSDCGHWSEFCYDTELMSPRAEASGISMPIARVTVASFEDLGYVVDYTAADPFAANLLNTACRCNSITGQPPEIVDVQESQASLEARAYAVAYGMELLAQQSGAEASDVGDRVISIIYLDPEGVIRDVLVSV
jgi:Leishmanolysin